jgi:hypothetical protein
VSILESAFGTGVPSAESSGDSAISDKGMAHLNYESVEMASNNQARAIAQRRLAVASEIP